MALPCWPKRQNIPAREVRQNRHRAQERSDLKNFPQSRNEQQKTRDGERANARGGATEAEFKQRWESQVRASRLRPTSIGGCTMKAPNACRPKASVLWAVMFA